MGGKGSGGMGSEREGKWEEKSGRMRVGMGVRVMGRWRDRKWEGWEVGEMGRDKLKTKFGG